ncbi:hypothetical protein [Actinomycetospora sp.]|jgi:hypothetical protein|uniref:hypothetical protein n=1 Tax=Actinomycetospora sp. TaxID=1872135 RepID=UPI002F406C5F
MTEGRTSAAEANVDAEDEPTSTGAAGAGDSAGTNGHESAGNGTTSSTDAEKTETSEVEESGSEKSDTEKSETVPAATLPGEDSESAPAHGDAADDKADDTKADDTAVSKADDAKAAKADTGAATAATGDEEWAEAEDKAYKKELRKGLMFGLAGGVVVGAVVALLLGAFVWPGYLMGPGNPDDTANQVTQALSAKDGPALDNLSCKGPDGKPVSQLSGQVLQFITKVAPAGPATTLIDTEARAPVDVTLSVQGQTQTLPSELVLGESKGDWCLKGLAQRQ